MNILLEILKFIGYSAVGFFAGYQFCRMRREVREIRDTIVKDEVDQTPVETRERLFGDRQSRVIGILVLLMSTITIISSSFTSYQNRQNSEHDREVTACQARYNDDFARAVTLRGQYADEDRTLLNTMIFTILDEPDPKKRQAAVNKWVRETQENDKLRKATPLPDLTTRNCG